VIDETVNDLRRAIIDNLIKNPKIFKGGKDNVQQWIEEMEHLFEIAHIQDATKLDFVSYSLRGDALAWFRNHKSSLTSWKVFVLELKKAFTSSFHEELAFKKLEAYSQGENQLICNFFNEILKLCKEADNTMSETTKLKHLLNKTKPSIQFEVRKKKPTSTTEFLQFAKEVEELIQLSNLSTSQIESMSDNKSDNNKMKSTHRPLASAQSFTPSTAANSHFNNKPMNYAKDYSRNFSNNYRPFNSRQTYANPNNSMFSQARSFPQKSHFTNSVRVNQPPTFSNDNRHIPKRFPSSQYSTPRNPSSHYSSANAINQCETATNTIPSLESFSSIDSNQLSEVSNDGVASGKNFRKPSKSSLIFFTTFVNNYRTKILIDTGATKTFVNKNLLDFFKPSLSIQGKSYSFFLADGVAPLTVLGTVKLCLEFANVKTEIEAHVAQSLCTPIILGMDYINLYNLSFNVKLQTISIEYESRILTMPINSDCKVNTVPVILSASTYIPAYSKRTTQATIPIDSVCSVLLPSNNLCRNRSLSITHTLLNFTNHCSKISFMNVTQFPQVIRKGFCVGYIQRNLNQHQNFSLNKLMKNSLEASGLPVMQPVSFSQNKKVPNSYISQNFFLPSIMYGKKSLVSMQSIYCNSVVSSKPNSNIYIEQLLKSVENKEYKNKLYQVLINFTHIFDISKHNIAKPTIHHVINTVPHSPPACKPYPQLDKEKPMFQLMQEFLKAGLISESHSPYAAPAILVKKKDGSFRFVVDYKKLNSITIKDASPLPNMEDTIRKLGQGYKVFSKLDLKSGFYQIPINPADKEKTAFVTPFGLYQFNVLPMGLKNSPPTFQKVMSDTLKNCRAFSLVYLDDIIIFSKSFDEHILHLECVLSALQTKNLVLNPPKCVLAANQIDYLGHTISQNRITPMKEKIDAILQIKEPRTLAQANKFIGALSWYRKFIPGFATKAAPIHAVTNLTKNKRYKFKWSQPQSKAFQELKQLLISAPLFLHYPVDNVPLMLATDASGIGIGGVLQQEIDGKLHNLYYHSQLMTPSERKYSTIEKEALAIYRCFYRMRNLILGRSIILRTDHCPLCHIMDKTIRNNRVERITHLIQEFNIEKIIHIKGKENCLPDFLSRYSNEMNDELFEAEYGLESKENFSVLRSQGKTSLNLSSFQNSEKEKLLASMVLRSHTKHKQPASSSKQLNSKHNNNNESSVEVNRKITPKDSTVIKFSCNLFDSSKIIHEQKRDPAIHNIVQKLNSQSDSSMSFIFKNDILYKLIAPRYRSKKKMEVIYLPSSMIPDLLRASHDDPMTGAHFSNDRIYHKIKYLYWWPDMKASIKNYIKSCILCKQYNISRQKKHGHLRPISPPDGPFLLIGIDYCGPLQQTPRENRYILVITDYFTRFVSAVALPTCTAEATAQALFNEYFCKYGIPAVILSDQGSHFRNQLMENIKQLIGYNHIYSTPYHPQTNGVVERFNATFIPQIAKLQDTQGNNWDEYLQAVVFAYNSGTHKTTNYSPYELLFGRSPRLPIEIPPSSFSFKKSSDYFEQLRKTLRIYRQAVQYNVAIQQQRHKIWYDRNRFDPHYNIGDKVLIKVHGNRGKLEPRFSPIPMVIAKVFHPVYIVEDEINGVSSRVHVADIRPILSN
ncbi:unnamed protein product, partial [Rotaria socialis]